MTEPVRPQQPQVGPWSLQYTGECAGREAEPLHITRLDDSAIVFDDFELLRGDTGEYQGSATFFASMPVDGREIPYEVSYALRPDGAAFRGMQTVVEGGGHGLGCPVELVPAGER